MHETLINLIWAATFALTGGLVGILLIFVATLLLPKLIDRFTPAMNEQQEIARGNRAVAEYFSRIVGASIVGNLYSCARPNALYSGYVCAPDR